MANEMVEREERTSWPYASLFWFGFFGTGDPAGKRLAWRTTGAFLLFVVSVMGAYATPIVALGIPAAALILIWAYKEYLTALDELSRRIQLEAFAWAYGAVFVVLFGLVAMKIGTGVDFHPMWVIVAEPLRGVALVLIAKRYA